MGERAASDRCTHRPIRLPVPVREGSPTPWHIALGAGVPALPAVVCCLALASCATTDSIAARRDREAQKLSEAEVWKSPTARIEPQVMASAGRDGGARAPASPRRSAGTRARLDTAGAEGREATATTTGAAAENETPGGALTADAGAPAGDPGDGEDDPLSWVEVPDEELIRQLLLRKLTQWESQAGGYSHASHLAPDDGEQRLARDLVTLSLLSEGPLDETGLEAAAMTLSATGDREDLLRAALALQQLGRTGESTEILSRLTERGAEQDEQIPATQPRARTGLRQPARPIETIETAAAEATPVPAAASAAAAPAAAAPAEASTFELVSVTFASRIDGPGDFVAMPAEAIEPGKDVLVYGEFAGFRTAEYRAEAGDQATHSRSFSASLRLQDAESNVLEELKFLPPSRGRQVVDDASEAVNFWARYQIPEDLGAGDYRIVINAEDHLGGQSAVAELSFAVR